ncbi:hypothetical protein DICSQDRAFT_175681, partial [Dichomitus squalens LYAD-421 SS1]
MHRHPAARKTFKNSFRRSDCVTDTRGGKVSHDQNNVASTDAESKPKQQYEKRQDVRRTADEKKPNTSDPRPNVHKRNTTDVPSFSIYTSPSPSLTLPRLLSSPNPSCVPTLLGANPGESHNLLPPPPPNPPTLGARVIGVSSYPPEYMLLECAPAPGVVSYACCPSFQFSLLGPTLPPAPNLAASVGVGVGVAPPRPAQSPTPPFGVDSPSVGGGPPLNLIPRDGVVVGSNGVSGSNPSRSNASA